MASITMPLTISSSSSETAEFIDEQREISRGLLQ
jgi:hypothetical protein